MDYPLEAYVPNHQVVKVSACKESFGLDGPPTPPLHRLHEQDELRHLNEDPP